MTNFGVGNDHSTPESVLGDICHLVAPAVGHFRMAIFHENSIDGEELVYYTERLADALRRAREVEEKREFPDAKEREQWRAMRAGERTSRWPR